jgi:hypothetical protein
LDAFWDSGITTLAAGSAFSLSDALNICGFFSYVLAMSAGISLNNLLRLGGFTFNNGEFLSLHYSVSLMVLIIFEFRRLGNGLVALICLL